MSLYSTLNKYYKAFIFTFLITTITFHASGGIPDGTDDPSSNTPIPTRLSAPPAPIDSKPDPSLPMEDKVLFTVLYKKINKERKAEQEIIPSRLSLLPNDLISNILAFVDVLDLLSFQKAYGRYARVVEERLFNVVIPWVQSEERPEDFFEPNVWETWDSVKYKPEKKGQQLAILSRCLDLYIPFNSWLYNTRHTFLFGPYWEGELDQGWANVWEPDETYDELAIERSNKLALRRALLRNLPFLLTEEMEDEIFQYECDARFSRPYHRERIVNETRKLTHAQLSERAETLRLYRHIVLCPDDRASQDPDVQAEIIIWALRHPPQEFRARALAIQQNRNVFLDILDATGKKSSAWYCKLFFPVFQISVEDFGAKTKFVQSHKDFFTDPSPDNGKSKPSVVKALVAVLQTTNTNLEEMLRSVTERLFSEAPENFEK